MRNTTRITLWIISALLALLFTTAGIGTFASHVVRDQFMRWGYPDFFRLLIGGLEIGGGLMLLVPRLAWRAALVLGAILLGLAITLWWHSELLQALVPSTLLLAVSMVGYARHPRATLMRRLRTAVDWVAEREIEEQRKKTAVHRALKLLKRPVSRGEGRLAKEVRQR